MPSVEGLSEYGGTTRRASVELGMGGTVKLELEGYENGGEALFTPARARMLAGLLEAAAQTAEQKAGQ